MEQQSPKKTEDKIVPEPAAKQPQEPEPAPVLRPEDEAVVAERLRELGYIE